MRGPTHFWDEETLADIMKACIIMHNMVIEDEGDIGNNDLDGSDANPPVEVSHAYTPELEDFMQSHYQIRDSVTHSQLQSDLIEHLWNDMATNNLYQFQVEVVFSISCCILIPNFNFMLYFNSQFQFHVVF